MQMWCTHSISQVGAKKFKKDGVAGGLVGPELRQGSFLGPKIRVPFVGPKILVPFEPEYQARA